MDLQETVLIVTRNLFFVPRVENAAAECGLEVEQVASEAAFRAEYGSRQVPLVLVDLEVDHETWTPIVRSLVEDGDAGPRIVAYGPHSEVALLAEAREAGCHAVLIKGEFDKAAGGSRSCWRPGERPSLRRVKLCSFHCLRPG